MNLEEALGHRFRDPELLERALTHTSHAHETAGGRGNERLEFLGDAVLDLLVAEALFRNHPNWEEGVLTRARAALVNTRSLAACARGLDLGAYVRLGRTELRTGGATKESILAALFEAVVGAVYLDAGLEAARFLVTRSLGAALERGAPLTERDPKTRFQEWTHARLRITPRYRDVADTGDERDEARFAAVVEVDGEAWGEGRGRTKREAERAAARAALARAAAADETGDG